MVHARGRAGPMVAAAFAVYLAFSFYWHLAQPAGHAPGLVVSDILTVIAPVAATLAGIAALRVSSGRERRGWAMIVAGAAAWAVAETTWSIYDIFIGEESPFPSFADVGYTLGIPMLTAGTIVLTGSGRQLLRPRVLLDTAARILIVSTVLWHFVLQPVFRDSGATDIEKVLLAWYPAADTVLLICTLAILGRVNGGARRVVGILALGHAALLFADLGFARLVVTDQYNSGDSLDSAWISAYTLIAVAAYVHVRTRPSYVARRDHALVGSVAAQVSPVITLVGIATYAVVMASLDRFQGDVTSAALCVLAALAVGARQLTILVDNRNLARDLSRAHADLESRVRERTRELSRLEAIIQSTPDLVATVAAGNRPVFLNRAGRRLLGLGDDDALPSDLVERWGARGPEMREALRDSGVWSGETTLAAAHDVVPVSAVVIHHDDGAERLTSAIVRDIGALKHAERELVKLANHDALTGLLNRRAFEALAEDALAVGQQPALLFVDLDGFKYVNDELGHRTGDDLLSAIGGCIRDAVADAGIVARLGGDEFAVMLPGNHLDIAEQVAIVVADSIRQLRFLVGGRSVRVTASVGIATAPAHGETLRDLLSNADLAMYAAKEFGDRTCVYSPGLRAGPFDSHLQWEQTIREAIEDDGLVLLAQPIRHLASGRRHYELLLRIRGPEGAYHMPGDFLPVAEQSGLIHQLDRWVVREAVMFAAAMQRTGAIVPIEVNLSGRAFADTGLLGLAREAITASGVDARLLIFEITETAAIADMPRARAFIESLRALGCRFAIDDFGAGFSSFAYLKHLPVDFLKIDGSFVVDLVADLGDRHLVRSMVQLARGLGKETVAEFVGDDATIEVLARLGVDYAQGYHIGEPVTLDSVLNELQADRRAA
ncbi:MAG: putative bifunctional diguanylate cyclase/phosphodiesterase [Dehalococcoidia bacterium]